MTPLRDRPARFLAMGKQPHFASLHISSAQGVTPAGEPLCYTLPMAWRLERNTRHRWFGGVASGLAKSVNLDTFLGRMLARFAFIAFAPALWWVYLLLWLLLPAQRLVDARSVPAGQTASEYKNVQKDLKAKRRAVRREYKRLKKELRRAKRYSKRYRQRYGDAPERPSAASQPAAPLTTEAKLNALLSRAEGRVPAEAFEKLVSIRAALLAVLPELEGMRRHNSKDAYNVQRTAETYLPETVKNYLSLPKDFAETHVLSNGKTAEATLVEQLGLLEATMRRIMTDVFREDADALLVHGRFLKEKFGTQPFDLPRNNGEVKAGEVEKDAPKALSQSSAEPFKTNKPKTKEKVRISRKESGF